MIGRHGGGHGLGSQIIRLDLNGRAALITDQVSPMLRRLAVSARMAGLRHVEYDAGRVFVADPETGERRELTCQADLDAILERSCAGQGV